MESLIFKHKKVIFPWLSLAFFLLSKFELNEKLLHLLTDFSLKQQNVT